MAFPSTIYGEYGDEKVSTTAGGDANNAGKFHALGQKMELPDGRVFRYARASATAIVAGKLYHGKAGEANTAQIMSLAVAGTNAVGDTDIVVTIPAGTALGANVFDDGYLFTASSIGTGIGHVYRIESASSCAAGSTTTVKLKGNETVHVAPNASTTVGLRKNPYDELLLNTANTVGTNTLAGVSAASAAASAYCWIQRRGPAAVYTAAEVPVIGQPVIAATTLAGAVAGLSAIIPANTGTVGAATLPGKSLQTVGMCMSVAGSTEYSLIDLMLE